MTVVKKPKRHPNPSKVREGSINAWLMEFDVGERRYFETTPEKFHVHMSRYNSPPSRRPGEMEGREFASKLFTAVSNSSIDTRLLICIERLK